MNKKHTCYECKDRHHNCYDTCEYYKEYRKRLDVIKTNRKLFNDLNNFKTSYKGGRI